MSELDWPVFGLSKKKKRDLQLPLFNNLTLMHAKACVKYGSLLRKFNLKFNATSIEDVPYIPVRLFKHEQLLSVAENEILKVMTSSGTGGQDVSKIYLDKETSILQVKVLSKIITDFIGPRRMPILVIDCRATVAQRYRFSARTTGIQGFSLFGKEVEFALDDDMTINYERILGFIEKYKAEQILIFGFTFIIWENFVRALEKFNRKFDFSDAILIHGGGWKLMEAQAVSASIFKERLQESTGVKKVHNYYGMVEQTGSIFMECEKGMLHSSAWSDIVIRDPITFDPLPNGEEGLIQLLSVIPRSYPGHSLLSEDVGVMIGVDDCGCGRHGAYFKVMGRIKNAEVRGCSDTYVG